MAFNKKLVRHVSFKTWSNLTTLFPSAICHMVKVNHSTENHGSVQCALCLRDQERKMDLSTNILSWANRVATDKVLSKILSESASPLVEMKTFRDKALEQYRYFFVHKDDLDEWRAAVNHICGTFSSMKGKETGKGRKMKSQLEQTLFKVHGYQITDDKKNEQLLHDFKFQSLVCRDHGSLLSHLSPIDEIISYNTIQNRVPLYCQGDPMLSFKNKVELLDSDEYQAYLTSLSELADVLMLSIQTISSARISLDDSSSNHYHPSVTIFVGERGVQHESSDCSTDNGILSLIACGCKVSFEPKLCLNRNCSEIWALSISQQQQQSLDNSETNTETKESIDVEHEVKESWSRPSSISFQIFEISDDTDIAGFCTSITQDRNPPADVESSGGRSRRSHRNRKRCTFVVNAEKDANVAKLKLLVSERTKIEHISEISFYLYLDNLLELDDQKNETSLSQLLGDVDMTHDPILLLQIQSNDGQLKKAERQDRDEVFMAHLMSMVGDSKGGRTKNEERGFQGTLLHSTPSSSIKTNPSNGNVVELT